jgi:hypothetical protein
MGAACYNAIKLSVLYNNHVQLLWAVFFVAGYRHTGHAEGPYTVYPYPVQRDSLTKIWSAFIGG